MESPRNHRCPHVSNTSKCCSYYRKLNFFFAIYISSIADTSTHWLSMTLIPRFLQASALESQRDGVDAESSNTANPPGGNAPGNSTPVTALPVTVPDNTPGRQHRTLALTDRRGFSNDGKFKYLNLLTSLTFAT
jgi:hypothetical protein